MSVIVIRNCDSYLYYNIEAWSIIKNLGLKPIFMYSTSVHNNHEKIVSFQPEKQSLYEDVVTYTNPITEETVYKLKNIKDLIAIIPYSEEDVLDAEYLSNALNLTSNPIQYSVCRRNKFFMQERIKELGLRGIIQKLCGTENDIIQFVENNALEKYVIKPIDSSSTEDVYVCSSLDELTTKFQTIIGKINSFGIKNENVLVQEYIEGDEWIINTSSRNGIHKIVNVYKYKKAKINNRDFVYLEMKLMDSNEINRELIMYAVNVLNALEFHNGSGHAEIKMTKTGPCLIEIGARTGGLQNTNVLHKCIGYSQIETNIYSYCSEEKFNTIPLLYKCKDLKGNCFCLVNYYDNIVWKSAYLNELLESLTNTLTLEDCNIMVKDGSTINKTIDLITIIGEIYVTSEKEENLLKAEKLIREWEQNLKNISNV